MTSRLATTPVFTFLCVIGLLSVLLASMSLAGLLLGGVTPFSMLEACCGGVAAKITVGWTLLAGVAGTLAVSLIRLAIAAARHAGAARSIASLRRISRSERVMGQACQVFEDRRPQAFCGGLLRPQVFLSRGLIDGFAPSELRAVVAHEAHHRDRRDPLRLALARGFADCLFFMPVLREFGGRYAERIEIEADRAAAEVLPGGRRDVARALVAFNGEADRRTGPSLSPGRIDDLAGRPSTWSPGRPKVIATLFSLAALLASPVVAHEAFTRTPLGIEALGIHICLVALILAPLAAVGAAAMARPRLNV